MSIFRIPLSPNPQEFGITIAGVGYRFIVKWNQASKCWLLDMKNTDNSYVVCGIPFVTGINLLSQLQHLDLGFGLASFSEDGLFAVPTFENLGETGNVFVSTP